MHLDVLVRLVGRTVAIEVKYLVAAFAGVVDDVRFDLPNQAAHDISRHDVVRDIVRLEQLVTDGYADDGVALILINDPAYWRPGTKAAPIDAAFRIHEGRQLAGILDWSEAAGRGTTCGRDRSLTLAGRYTCLWRPNATVVGDGDRRSQLRYLAIEVSDRCSPAAQPSPTAGVREPSRPADLDPVASSNPGANAREEILVAVRGVLDRSGGTVFEIGDVLAEMRRRGTRYSDSTIRTHITSRMCANAPGL